MTSLCVAIFVTDAAQARRDIARAAELGADMVELRVDQITPDAPLEELKVLVRDSTLPCIVTCRPSLEGGNSELSDEDRLAVLKSLSQHGFPYVDVELALVRREPHAQVILMRPLIVSAHDFQGRPLRLHSLLLELNEAGGNVTKIVWTARSIRDNLEAFEILQRRSKPTIALCMGEAGLISRVLAKKFGGFLTFTSLEQDSVTAPGQVPVTEMKRLYRWDAIRSDTKVYGVVAQPVAHSMSPAVHNAAFDHVGYNGVYLPLLVNAGYESFKAFMESFVPFAGLDLSGLSVTIPHKENALRYLQEKGAEIDPLAVRTGAVNTICIDRHESGVRLRGLNTDYGAILDSITTKLGISRDDLARYRVAVIGAGGTGRTAVAALAHCGATVVVYNRTHQRADALAAEFNGQTGKVVAAPIEKLCDSCCQIYINTTSLGMHPNVHVTPFGDAPPALSSDTLVFDTVYNPLKTKLIRNAEAAGAKTIPGIEMFVRQAAAQFQVWTNLSAPTEMMRAVIQQRLEPAS